MAKIYFDGTDIIPVNQEYAVGLILECAKHDNAAALNWAGYLYMNGIVVEKNSGIARNYFKKAIDRFKPNPNAMHHLAWAYDQGKGVEKDITIALKWMTRAAAAGQVDAMLCLGKFYLEHEFRMEDGTVWKDTDAAVHWISEAAIAGSSEGAYILSHIFQGDYDLFDSVSYCFYLEDLTRSWHMIL